MSIKIEFSKKVYYARKRMGLSQDQLAEAVSASKRWIQKIEKGSVLPGGLIMIRLIIFLDLDIKDMEDIAGVVKPVPFVR